ncbi:MAG: hypothetical protein ABJB39_01745 [Chloroflexota bacterium]
MLDRTELAWAAGFFDGEGSTIARTDSDRPGYRQLNITVPQVSRHGVPPLLERFQRAMLGMGRVTGPTDEYVYALRFNAREEAELVLQLLWPDLGSVKRTQARCAITLVEQNVGLYRTRKSRKQAPHVPDAAPRSIGEIDRAWAAGFLDAEGCFGLNRGRTRARGPAWYRVRVSADQHGVVGIVPEVLVRLQRTLGGLGRIDRHGAPDDYKWSVEGPAAIEEVLALTSEWLGQEKREDARNALTKFTTQIRLKGDATRCVRGHLYTRVAMKGGRLRRICNACERLTDRARRAAIGVPPRPFKDVSRRYTA